ncbi:60S ribosomal protein L14-2-like [Hevea brasiliensis]|uniref:60S ribosomal protein L14-2-like n=1 Tax=Hevea brasiliensis TaxID=3981 RepID=UPI0025DE0E04|nr:60S ribosomal protein L14-2-like [Hevea brasiliensis]
MFQTPPDLNMPFKRYVEIGKVALVNYGKHYRKLSVIVNVIDQNRATIGTPEMATGKEGYRKKIKVVVMMRIFARKISTGEFRQAYFYYESGKEGELKILRKSWEKQFKECVKQFADQLAQSKQQILKREVKRFREDMTAIEAKYEE